MKRIGLLLALLMLFSMLAVQTNTVNEVKADATSQYFIIIENATESYINTTLSGVTWEYATPQYTVKGNVIYFPNLQNMTRFLTPPDFKNDFVFPLDKIETSVPITIVWFYGWDGSNSNADIYFNITSTENQTPFAWARIRWDSGSYPIKYYFYVNDNLVFTSSEGQVKYYSQSIAVAPGDQLHFKKSDPYSGSGASLYSGVFLFFGGTVKGTFTASGTNKDYGIHTFEVGVRTVTFHFTDALTGSALSGVTVKEGSNVLGTLDDGGTLELAKGTHELTFEKSGYWSVTKTIDVQSDMTVSVELYPSSAAFKLENFPANISIPENTIYELTFTLSPIQTSATYNTYLSLSGLSDVISVEKGGSVISPENGKYYLGDISSPVQVSIKFKAGAVGQHGFLLTLTSNDAIMSKTYTTTKQVTYQVEPLPFSVQMPSEWQVGENQLRISESSGQSYLITAVLKDSSGNEVWSDSYAFSPYEAHTFSINVPAEGSYTLELQWNGQTAVYSIQVNPAITLKTKQLTVSKGGEGTIVLHFKNPSSSVQYYTIVVSGGFLPAEINQSISVAPLTEKDVSIAFAVPEDLTYDAYELNVAVMQGNATVFSDKVAVSISDSSGFSLFGGGSSGGSTFIYLLAGLMLFGGLIWALRRRRR